MFERNRIDNVPEPTAVPVELALIDGTVLKGKLLVPIGKVLADLLNSPGGFVEFEPYGGERSFLAKAQLASVKAIGVPRAPGLAARTRDADGFDPHAILGIPANAPREDVRQAYYRLAKVYHPDRFAHADLPAEVADYLAAMARRINAAYAALDVPQQPAPSGTRSAPIYTTVARA